MSNKNSTVVFTCESYHEAAVIYRAAGLYRHVLRDEGIDPPNYAPANAQGAGFGWDTVHQAARDMHRDSRTYMSVRIATALKLALLNYADHTQDDATMARTLASRMQSAITGN